MNLLQTIAVFSLIMSGLNWLIFMAIVFLNDLPRIKELFQLLKQSPVANTPAGGIGVTVQHSGVDPVKLAAVTGTLAEAFKKAGPASSAAALSVLFLLAALIAAGVDKIPGR